MQNHLQEVEITGTRARILRAAAEAFSERGFKSATTKHIAEIAGINEITVYRYFPKKKDLYWEVIDWKVRTQEVASGIIESLLDNRQPRDFLVRVCRAILNAFGSDPGLFRLLLFAHLELEAEGQRLYETHYLPAINLLSERIREWQAEGLVGPMEPNRAASVAGMILFQFAIRGLNSETTEMNPEALAQECTGLCMHGLFGESASEAG